MDTKLAEEIARGLMKEHGLVGWRFKWTTAKRRFGACNYAKMQLQFSKPLAELNDMGTFVDTVLHEIAHALTPGHKHDAVWKKKVAELGGTPRATVKYGTANLVKAKNALVCQKCGRRWERHRVTQGQYGCVKCNNILVWEIDGVVQTPTQMKALFKERNVKKIKAYQRQVARNASW